MICDVVEYIVENYAPTSNYTTEDFDKILHQICILTELEVKDIIEEDYSGNESVKLQEQIQKVLKTKYDQYRSEFPEDIIQDVERWTVLGIVDYAWKVHLQNLDHLKEGIGLRGYGQKNPLYEYKKEAYLEFCQMVKQTKWDIVKRIFKIKPSEVSKKIIEEIEAAKQQEIEQIQNFVKKSHQNEVAKPKKTKKKRGGFFGR